MKKLMTSTIIILPLIILAIMLVSGAIISLVTHIYVEKVEFSNSEAIVLVMDDETNPPTHDLKAEITVFPLEAPNRDIVYTDYDKSLLKISDDGIVTPLFYGETYVTVQSVENKAATATRKIIVTANHVHALKLNEYQKDWYEGDTAQFSVSVYPQEAENKSVTWSSSDADILQIASSGMATAKGNGKVTITATSKDTPEVTASAEVVCHAKIRGLDFDDNLLQTSLTEVQFPTVAVSPDPCDATVKYSVDNARIAAVDELTGKLIFKTPGKVTVTVTGTDFKGNSVTGQKTIVSTMGYFVGPLFDNKEVNFADCSVGAALPLNFAPKLEGTYKLIGEIEYTFDSPFESGKGQTGLIAYNESEKVFKLTDNFPEFDNYVNIIVHATIYDSKDDALNSTYEDFFYITKSAIENNSKVTYNGSELTADDKTSNNIEFSDINEKVVLTLYNPDAWRVQIDGNAYVDAERDGNTVTLTSKEVCKAQQMLLSIGTKSFYLNVSVRAKAQWIKVACRDTQLSSGGDGKTLLDSLNFTVEKGRSDGKTVESEIKYKVGADPELKTLVGKEVTLDFTDSSTELEFICDDVTFTYTVVRDTLSDFGFDAVYSTAAGVQTALQNVPSANAQKDIELNLPKDSQNTITFKLNITDFENYLGGLGTDAEFKEIFKVTAGEKVCIDYDVSNKQINVTPYNPDFNEMLTLDCGAIQVSLHIVKVNIEEISFIKGTESFDMKNPQDVYKGYQQVRVFAKHSYYNGKEVDYFRLPLKVLSTLVPEETPASVENTINAVNWTLSGYKEKSLEKELTTQKGDTVTIEGKEYKIAKDGEEYVLQDDKGATVSGKDGKNGGGYIWIDVFSEANEGYVRIYFGNFGGLSEVDVQNDYFGDFGEQGEKWKKVENLGADPEYAKKEGSGRDFTASANAYTFLQVRADDGTLNGENCHFNFNVLEDDALVNVFNAAGYINTANKKIVLHNNLYGPEELGGGDATPDILTINSTDSGALGKTLIYGNGYQVNLQAKNKALCDELKDKENTGTGGITFGTLYNVTLKGTNTTGEVGCKTHKILMSMNGAYYSDLQCYSKMNPASTKMFLKNTVLRYVANAAVQLYMGSNPYNLYFENVVAVECMRVVSLETTQISNFNLKGFFDILDYNNAADLQNKYNSINGGWLYAMSLTESAIKEAAPNHIEWFGSNGNDYSKSNYKYYVNIGVIQQGSDDIFKERHWDEKENKYSEAVTSEQVRFSNIQLIQGLATAHIPNALNSADGGASDYKSRNTDLLFTDTRDIRLLCQFRTINGTKLEKNTEHIQWHMDKVHRDMSLIKNRTEDHITALKESLKNVTWPDGTGTDGDGNVKAVAAAMNSLLSQAIVPGKREYAVV